MDIKNYNKKTLFKILSNKEKEISFLKTLCYKIEKLEENQRAYIELEKNTSSDMISSINAKNNKNIDELKQEILYYMNERY